MHRRLTRRTSVLGAVSIRTASAQTTKPRINCSSPELSLRRSYSLGPPIMTAQNNNTKVAAPVTQQLREYYTADELDALIRIAERFVGYYTQPGDRASLSGEAI